MDVSHKKKIGTVLKIGIPALLFAVAVFVYGKYPVLSAVCFVAVSSFVLGYNVAKYIWGIDAHE